MNLSKIATSLAAALAAIAIALPTAFAEVPTFYPVQGYLTDADGNPIDGEVDIRFRLYDDADNEVFTELAAVTVNQGAFTHNVGTITSLDAELFAQFSALTLGVKVGTDTEMAPRLEVGSVPYAARAASAANAETLDGNAATDFVAQGQAGAITAPMLAEGAVTLDAVEGALPIYRVTNQYCDVRPGTLSFNDTCYANQKLVSTCNNTCNLSEVRVRNCDGECGCMSIAISGPLCPIGVSCPPSPWPNGPRCNNTLVGHILPQ
ncbi:hypothetical protein DL240_06675 [Lujinxingia litoralis]|uniref:Uncharacterized protein n=1 Tax=Lujinxingia litoralis TaxID=2211119 RepID=A0A328CD05_9DELT|nr:hypothetical protein [Lujinxingia litoralis]RAL23831.1 hypothetical protein DL240_06675 [Lujinxingia litoralis]